MISASKSTLSLNNLKILRPKVTKYLTNLRKKFCEFPPRVSGMEKNKKQSEKKQDKVLDRFHDSSIPPRKCAKVQKVCQNLRKYE